jgi:RNA polymerase sigma-70 factor (ECF subfamily)
VIETEQVTRAKAGDEVAWDALVRQHQQAVFRLAYLLLRDADDAEDVTQETFIRAYRGLHRFDSSRPLRPWLLEITRNQCANWGRALRRRLAAWQRWGETVPLAETDPNEPMVEQQMIAQWKAKTLWQAVGRLKSSDQEILYLRCFLELSVEETAQALTIAPGTVKSRLSRALERLRGLVAEEFPGLHEEVTQ